MKFERVNVGDSLVIEHTETGETHVVTIDRVRGDTVNVDVETAEGWEAKTFEEYDAAQRLTSQLNHSNWFNDAENVRTVVDHACDLGYDTDEIADVVRNPAKYGELYLDSIGQKTCSGCRRPIDKKSPSGKCSKCRKYDRQTVPCRNDGDAFDVTV